MTFRTYLEFKKETLVDFCKSHDFEYFYLKHIRAGRARPSPDLALRISEATGGKVKVLDLLFPAKRKSKS